MTNLASFRVALIGSVFLMGGADWPKFRGPDASSVAADAKLPVTWGEGQNIVWRIDLPGRGVSGPIIVRDRVFITATSGFRHTRLHVLCFNATTGDRLWERQFWATGRTSTHNSISGAAPTPASDGKYVYAFFSSNDLVCLDFDGNLLWYRGLAHDYPKSGNDVGMACSPLVVDGVVVVQVESQSEAFAVGVDASTGENRWRVERSKVAGWSSPIAIPGKGGRKTSVLLQSRDRLTAHEPRSGEELWRWEAECAATPSSLVSGDVLFTPMGGLTALKFSDESSSPEVLWDAFRMRPGAPSPIVYDGRVYALSGAILKCADAQTGELQWQLRLKGNHWATPVVAGGHMYCINFDGEARVVKLGGAKGEIVGEHAFGQQIHASPAIVDNAMYVRCDKYLWKIAEVDGS
ncbi:MAG: PQQ-binding-like beta-propeller repeat protein [Planctomycetes bacterium]|nr:PQQ-binding-like beta-propeller repeat protein [Planctomycetota bacterium]MBL7041338.1 PQQ-binding-like beta-propeller repeat protein [Pirellulaceae bacterium]